MCVGSPDPCELAGQLLYVHDNTAGRVLPGYVAAGHAVADVSALGHELLRLAHILLFAYWLGADLGVFLAGGRMSRPGISVVERNRIRDLLMDIDLAPRVALVLMLPVGFSLSLRWGAPLPPALLPVLWLVALGWTAVLLRIHFGHGGPAIGRLLKADLVVRVLVMVTMGGLGLLAIAGREGDVPAWLGAKFLTLAAIILVGIALRYISGQWRIAMDRFAAGDVAGGERLLLIRRRKAVVAALSMWALVAVAGFLGVVKPFG